MARRTAIPDLKPATETAADWIFFVLGGAAAVWFAWVLLRQSFGFGWWQIAFVVVFWALLAYLVLPRLHQILTSIYVPDYFIGRARTSDGLLGDPVNIALLGDEAQIHATMLAAGWTRADDLSVRTGLRIIRSTVIRRSYLEAPVSPLLLFSRKQDFAYQQEVNGSPGKRHHVRFWKCPDGWRLPGGRHTDWLAAGTYDRSVGFSLFTLQVTHKIAADTDAERDHIVSSMRAADAAVSVSTIEGFSAGYHSRNGGGDSIETDGDLPVVSLKAVVAPAAATSAPTDSRDRRPAAIVVGSALLALTGIATIVSGVDEVTRSAPDLIAASADLEQFTSALLIAIAVVVGVIGLANVLVAWRVFLGKPRARILAMVLSLAVVVLQIIDTETGDKSSIASNLPSVALAVLVLLALSSERAMTYAHRMHKAPKRISGLPGDRAPF
ncbi:MAG: LssY C-terminal domain-containing protein [Rhodoglobus sp.]